MPAGRHILLVDDDPIFLASMAAALRQSRYRVTTAEHCEPALNLLESADKPDVIVTDIMMPRSINGVALARMARLRHRPIISIFITGYALPELEEMAFGPVLRKPVEPAQLIAAIEAEHTRLTKERANPSPPAPAAPPDAA